MGLRNSSLAKKNDDTLTWVLHKREPSLQDSGQKSYETENANILVTKSYGSTTTSEYRGRRYNNHVQRKSRNHVNSNILDYGQPAEQTYGYGIADLDDFLSKASIGRPGNIPMVLSTGCLMYQTQLDDHYQTEVALPLGMVVNAVFKNEQWLYVQTPHAEEGYIPYGSCLPLGIVPPPDADRTPCWETQSDVFPRPVGDRRHRRRRHHDRGRGHRERPSSARSSVDSGAGGENDDDVATLLFRRRHCGPDTMPSPRLQPASADENDDVAHFKLSRRRQCGPGFASTPRLTTIDTNEGNGRRGQCRPWPGSQGKSCPAPVLSITGYGYL